MNIEPLQQEDPTQAPGTMPAVDEQPQGQEPAPKPAKPVEAPTPPPEQQQLATSTSIAQSKPFADVAPSAMPPADFREKLQRLIKARADALQLALVDDRGRVLREPMDPEDAYKNAIEAFSKHMQADNGPESMRTYFSGGIQPYGGTLPNGWVPTVGTIKSHETQELEWRAKVGREQSPIYAAIRDYLIDPIGNIIPAATQVGADVAVGILHKTGVLDKFGWNNPDGSIPRIDVKGKIFGLGGTTRDELAAIEAAKGSGGRKAEFAGEMVGQAWGYGAGLGGKVLGVGGNVGGAVGQALFRGAAAGRVIGHSAGMFATYGGLTAKTGEVLQEAGKGALEGAAMGFAQNVTSFALRKMFGSAKSALAPTEKEAMDSLRDWASENKLTPQYGESAKGYDKRVVDAWIEQGLPGAPKMLARTLTINALRAGADAIGFSAIDQQFRESLLKAAWDGDRKSWDDALDRFSGNFLGAAALRLGSLQSIVPWQRRQGTDWSAYGFGKAIGGALRGEMPQGTPQSAPKSAYGEGQLIADTGPAAEGGNVAATGPAAVDVPFGVRPDEPKQLTYNEPRGAKLQRQQDADLARQHQEMWDLAINGGHVDQDWLISQWGGAADNVIPLGWQPTEASVRARPGEEPGERIKVEIPQTEHSLTIDGDVARPSQSLQDALGLPASMPADHAIEVIEKATLASALQAKATLPGTEVSVGMKATPGAGTEPGVLRRVVMGKIQESPLQPNPEWKDAEIAPRRGSDATDPEQQQAVGVLRNISDQSEKLTPDDRTLLNSAIHVLDTVAASNDQAVAETMKVLPQMADAIEAGEPGAVKALAESLTTKTPERAQADAQRAKAAVKTSATKQSWTKLVQQIAENTAPEANREELEAALLSGWPKKRVARNAEGKIVAAISYSNEAGGPIHIDHLGSVEPGGGSALMRDVTKEADRQGKTISLVEAKSAEGYYKQFGFEPKPDSGTPGLQIRQPQPRDRSGERGHVSFESDPNSPAAKAVDAILSGYEIAKRVARAVIDKFQRSQIQRVEDLGMRQEAELGRTGVTNAKRYQNQMDNAGLIDLRRMAPVESLGELQRDPNGGYADRFSRMMDAGNANHFGAVTDSTPEERAAVAKARGVTQEAGRIAESIGIEQTDSKGKNRRAFKFDPNREVQVREYTPEMQEARITRSGPLWDAVINWLEKTYGWTPQEAEAHFTEGRNLTALDATEVKRSIPAFPTHIDVPGVDKPVRIMESRPKEYSERLAYRASNILGTRSVLPRFSEEPPKPGAKTLPPPPNLEPLDPTAQQLVDRVLNENRNGRGQENATAVARMVRAMQGMPLDPGMRFFRPGEPGYHAARVAEGIIGLLKASRLTMAGPQNLSEPLANVPYFGSDATSNSYREAMQALLGGGFAALHRRGVESGFLADTKQRTEIQGNTWAEKFESMLKRAGEVLSTPINATQDFNEAVQFLSAEKRLAAMQKGEGTPNDASALSLLGFKRPEIDAMLTGNGTPEQYERYQRNIVGELAGGKSQRGAQKSDAAHSQKFNSLVWFTNFFQTRTRAMAQLARDIREAPVGSELRQQKWEQFGKFAAMTMVGSALAGVVKNFLSGGSDQVADYIRENTAGNSPTQFAGNLLSLFTSGVFGGLGQPVATAFQGAMQPGDSTHDFGQAVLRALGPVDAGRQFYDYVRAGIGGMDVPGYENTNLLSATGKYLRNVMPAARTIHEGLFGSSALAISDKNPELDNAQNSLYRWLRANDPAKMASVGGADRETETRGFRDAMRRVADRINAGKGWDDDTLVGAVVDAEAARMRVDTKERRQAVEQGARPHGSLFEDYQHARQSVVSSLEDRKMLPKPGTYSTDLMRSLEAHLGPVHMQTLRDYDTVLDALAKRVKNANLRAQVDAKGGSGG